MSQARHLDAPPRECLGCGRPLGPRPCRCPYMLRRELARRLQIGQA